jgi:site-specific recombinase XerD
MCAKKVERLPRGIFEKFAGSRAFWIRYVDADGKLHREKAGNLSAAKNLLSIRRAEKLNGKLPDIEKASRKVLLSTLIDDAITHCKSENDPTVAHDFELKMAHVREAFGRRPAESINKQQWAEWLDERASKHDWKASTSNRWKAAVSLVYRVGMENEKIDRNPVSRIRRKQEANDRVRYLTLEEENRLVQAIAAKFPAYIPIFRLSIASGMRFSEQLRSRVGDFDPKTGMLTVHQKKDRDRPMVRYTPLGKVGAEAYSQLAAGKKKGARLCMNTEGTPMTDSRYWFDPALAEAGIGDYTWHDNRHSACSRWVMGGVPLAAVAKYVGHSTVQMTMRYAHLMPGANMVANSVVDAFYESAKQLESGVQTDTRTDTSSSRGFAQERKLL